MSDAYLPFDSFAHYFLFLFFACIVECMFFPLKLSAISLSTVFFLSIFPESVRDEGKFYSFVSLCSPTLFVTAASANREASFTAAILAITKQRHVTAPQLHPIAKVLIDASTLEFHGLEKVSKN